MKRILIKDPYELHIKTCVMLIEEAEKLGGDYNVFDYLYDIVKNRWATVDLRKESLKTISRNLRTRTMMYKQHWYYISAMISGLDKKTAYLCSSMYIAKE